MNDSSWTLIPGGLHADDRGTVAFVNDLDLAPARRFYLVSSPQTGPSRGWIAHERDHKWFVAVRGTILVALVRPRDWKTPDPSLPVERVTLTAVQPSALHVPPGYATATLPLAADSLMLVFSKLRMDEAQGDDHRYPPTTWQIEQP